MWHLAIFYQVVIFYNKLKKDWTCLYLKSPQVFFVVQKEQNTIQTFDFKSFDNTHFEIYPLKIRYYFPESSQPSILSYNKSKTLFSELKLFF